MRNSLNRKLTFIFSGIVLVACLLLLGTCSWIFRSVESTVKNIRYDDILSGYKAEVKAEVETALSIVQHYYGLSQSGKITEDQAKSDAEEALRDFRYGDDGSIILCFCHGRSKFSCICLYGFLQSGNFQESVCGKSLYGLKQCYIVPSGGRQFLCHFIGSHWFVCFPKKFHKFCLSWG